MAHEHDDCFDCCFEAWSIAYHDARASCRKLGSYDGPSGMDMLTAARELAGLFESDKMGKLRAVEAKIAAKRSEREAAHARMLEAREREAAELARKEKQRRKNAANKARCL